MTVVMTDVRRFAADPARVGGSIRATTPPQREPDNVAPHAVAPAAVQTLE
jgi:hypothetical protein